LYTVNSIIFYRRKKNYKKVTIFIIKFSPSVSSIFTFTFVYFYRPDVSAPTGGALFAAAACSFSAFLIFFIASEAKKPLPNKLTVAHYYKTKAEK